MSFKQVIGQEIPKQILEQALSKDRLANTYLFYGPPGVGKFLLAWKLAQILLCEQEVNSSTACNRCSSCQKVSQLRHPDLYLIFPHPSANKPKEEQEFEERFRKIKLKEPYQIVEYSRPINISTEKIRFLKEQIYRLPFQSERKVVIVEQAESMRTDSTNLLLKIFEEPPKDTIIILTTSQIDRILPTVVSRSQKIRLAPLSPEVIKAELQKRFSLEEEKAHLYASLSEGSLGIALNFASGKWEKALENSCLLWQALLSQKTQTMQELIEQFNLEKDRPQVLLLLKIWHYLLRDLYLSKAGVDSSHLINSLYQKEIFSLKKFPSRRIYQASQIVNQARLDFFRNL